MFYLFIGLNWIDYLKDDILKGHRITYQLLITYYYFLPFYHVSMERSSSYYSRCSISELFLTLICKELSTHVKWC